MSKEEIRRVNPIAHVTLVAVILVGVFELLVVGGVLELKARTVAKYAPWAYETFLKLVGEHPDSASRRVAVEETAQPEDDTLVKDVLYLQETNNTASVTNALPVVDPVLDVTPTNAPTTDSEDFVPVG